MDIVDIFVTGILGFFCNFWIFLEIEKTSDGLAEGISSRDAALKDVKKRLAEKDATLQEVTASFKKQGAQLKEREVQLEREREKLSAAAKRRNVGEVEKIENQFPVRPTEDLYFYGTYHLDKEDENCLLLDEEITEDVMVMILTEVVRLLTIDRPEGAFDPADYHIYTPHVFREINDADGKWNFWIF